MNIVADRYQFRARIIPEFLTVLPLLIIIAAFLNNLLVLGFLSFALFFIFFQGYFSSRLGRRLEDKLRTSNNLFSNTQYLIDIHEEDENHRDIKMIELVSHKIGIDTPFVIDGEKQKTEQLEQIIAWLIEHTRDSEKFPAVFDKLCDYGFYRNMLAMKPYAFIALGLSFCLLAIPSITIHLWPAISISTPSSGFNGIAFETNTIWLLLIAVWFVFWSVVVSTYTMNEARKKYLETLLQTGSSVEGESKATPS